GERDQGRGWSALARVRLRRQPLLPDVKDIAVVAPVLAYLVVELRQVATRLRPHQQLARADRACGQEEVHRPHRLLRDGRAGLVDLGDIDDVAAVLALRDTGYEVHRPDLALARPFSPPPPAALHAV